MKTKKKLRPIALQYISKGATPNEHLTHIENVCKAGCQWVQLRLKEVDLETHLEIAKKARKITLEYGATLIINDNIGIASLCNADGVHLGLEDTCPLEARKQLPKDSIIGGTCNTLEQALYQISKGVDYLGIGPFKHTVTKKKLSPILGKEGISKTVNALLEKNHNLPIVAIGGITKQDLEAVVTTGVSQVALSGALTCLTNDANSLQKLKTDIETFNQYFL